MREGRWRREVERSEGEEEKKGRCGWEKEGGPGRKARGEGKGKVGRREEGKVGRREEGKKRVGEGGECTHVCNLLLMFVHCWQSREHFCQVVQLVRNRMIGDQDQDSITVFVGTWNMGEGGGGRE